MTWKLSYFQYKSYAFSVPRYHVCGWDLARFSGRRSARFRSKLGIVKERFTYATSPRASQRHVSLASLRWLYRGGRANAREFRGSKNFSNQIVANRQQEQIPRGLRRLCRNQCRRSAAQSNFRLYLDRVAKREQHSMACQGCTGR